MRRIIPSVEAYFRYAHGPGHTAGEVEQNLTMEARVSNTVRNCIVYQLCQLRSEKRSLTLETRGRTLATACVATVASTTATVSYTVSRKKFGDFQWF